MAELRADLHYTAPIRSIFPELLVSHRKTSKKADIAVKLQS
jgi:hypothetical protein